MTILITGNPVDGFQYHGPFDSTEDAADWASRTQDADWWVAPVQHAELSRVGE